MELQQNTAGLPGGYGLYRNPYNNPAGPGSEGFPGSRGHLGGYPFPPMAGHNSYPGYSHLGYPGSASPGGDGKNSSIVRVQVSPSRRPVPKNTRFWKVSRVNHGEDFLT